MNETVVFEKADKKICIYYQFSYQWFSQKYSRSILDIKQYNSYKT